MRIRSALIATALLYLACLTGGCSYHELPSRTYDVGIDGRKEPTVVLTEVVEHSGGGDCPQFDPDRVVGFGLTVSGNDARLVVVKPAASSGVFMLGLRFWNQDVRWTVFRPGYPVMTVYPEGFDLSNLALSPCDCRQAVAGELSTSTATPRLLGHMIPAGAGNLIGRPYPTNARHVALTLVTPCTEDAATFAEQLDSLVNYLRRTPSHAVGRDAQRALLATIDSELNALTRAGLGADRLNEFGAQTTEIRKLLKIPPVSEPVRLLKR